jgi:hypothetical protein
MSVWQTLVIALVTAVLTWFGHSFVALLQRQTDRDKALELEKREAYKRLTKFLFGILKASKKGAAEAFPIGDFETELFELFRDMTVYASDNVLRLFNDLRSAQSTSDPKQFVAILAKLLLAIRKDLGHGSTTLHPKELLSAFIVDIESL